MKVLLVEPPKDYWFVMGEYLPPPLGLLQLAAFLEKENGGVEIDVLDCQAKSLDWKSLEKYIESSEPEVVAASGFATCNTYTVVRTLETAKRVNPNILTVVGGQHFTSTARESLEAYPEIDVIVQGEGERTLAELIHKFSDKENFSQILGISFRHQGEIHNTRPRPLIENLDELPLPGYHFVEDVVDKYHFTMMAGPKSKYALIEGSRGCQHRCSFCTQWRHWGARWRLKSARRIADEMEFCHRNYGSEFLWLTDDNLGLGKRVGDLSDELIARGFSEDIMWFAQARCDDVIEHQSLLPKMRKSGCRWILLGVESNNLHTLETFNKQFKPEDAVRAVKILKDNDIFAHAMFIIGEREDSAKSISELREFVNDLDPDLAIFGVLTPFPGTEIYEEAKRQGWIEDLNWANYDMVHAIMPTATLSREEVQEELYECYRDYYGSWSRRLKGIFSKNSLKRKTNTYLASQGLLKQLKALF